MKRCLLAVAAVLGPLVGLVSADYVIIKIDLNKPLIDPPRIGINPGDPMGGSPMGGSPMGGSPMGGYPGGPMGGSPMGGSPMGGGYPGGPMGGGYPGGPMGGGYPGGPMGSPMGGGPMGGEMPGDPMGGVIKEAPLPPLWAYACFELKKVPMVFRNYGLAALEQKWGKAIYVPFKAFGKYVEMKTVAARFADRKAALDKKDKSGKSPDKSPEQLVLLAEWALEHGLIREFLIVIDDLKTLAPDHAVVKTVEQTRTALQARPERDDPAAVALVEELSREDYRTIRSKSGHYTLLTNVKGAAGEASIGRRLARMEDTYQGFYYWFALKGRPLAVPNHRLVAVLADSKGGGKGSGTDFDSKHLLFDQVPMVADGFTARRENVVVMASTRLDEAYATLVKNNHSMWTNQYKVTEANLLNDAKIAQTRPDLGAVLPMLQTLAMLQRAMEEESEAATVTHECARQLYSASGLLPRNVVTAEWARFGGASFFETPHRAFHTNFGGPNWTHLISFKYLRKSRKLGDKQALETLLNVISDAYFNRAYDLEQQVYEAAEEKQDELAARADDQLEIARSTAWALTHYLAHNHLDKLLKFYKEVSSLPRDVDYDEDVLKNCFGRAFGLMTSGGKDGKETLDLTRLGNLANAWFRAMDLVQLEQTAIEREELMAREPPRPPPQKGPPVAAPGTTPADPPGTAPKVNPGKNPGANPGSNPGANPGSNPGANPGSNPGRVIRPGQGSNPVLGPRPGPVRIRPVIGGRRR